MVPSRPTSLLDVFLRWHDVWSKDEAALFSSDFHNGSSRFYGPGIKNFCKCVAWKGALKFCELDGASRHVPYKNTTEKKIK